MWTLVTLTRCQFAICANNNRSTSTLAETQNFEEAKLKKREKHQLNDLFGIGNVHFPWICNLPRLICFHWNNIEEKIEMSVLRWGRRWSLTTSTILSLDDGCIKSKFKNIIDRWTPAQRTNSSFDSFLLPPLLCLPPTCLRNGFSISTLDFALLRLLDSLTRSSYPNSHFNWETKFRV